MQVQHLPDPTTWRFVLVHVFLRVQHEQTIHLYDRVVRSFPSLHHGEVKPTLVLSDINARDRILKLGGWQEVTAEVGPHTPKLWNEELGKWRLDPEGHLPWERVPTPKNKLATLEAEEHPQAGDEVVIDGPPQAGAPKREPRGAAAAAMKKQEPLAASTGGEKQARGPTSRPRSG